jgi:hypothetical protein
MRALLPGGDSVHAGQVTSGSTAVRIISAGLLTFFAACLIHSYSTFVLEPSKQPITDGPSTPAESPTNLFQGASKNMADPVRS